MVRPRSFRRKVFTTVMLVALTPGVVALVAVTALLTGMGTGSGTLGPWDAVARSGGELIEAAQAAAPGDSAVARVAEAHQRALSASLRQSRLYSFVAQRTVQILPLAAVAGILLLAALSALAARRISRRLGGPVGELVEWTRLVAAGDPIPSREEDRRPFEEFQVLREALRNMAGRLEAARAREVEAARVHAWSDMARRVAHELKNPLTPIRIGAASLTRNADPGVRDTGEMILEEVGRLDGMARDFSRFGRPPQGPAAPVDVAELLESLRSRHAPDGPDAPRVELDLADELPWVHGHHDALSRAVLNLLVNALEALDGTADGRVILSARPMAGGVEISVADNGPGVPEELRDQVWRPDVTTRRRGSGLGLAMVRQTAQAHGGEVRLVERSGGGADFRMVLPGPDG
ncbi:MAG TPA: HAMP domain-containing sensor histidine kinase [Longimicrobiales bacterium]|nr:HAMP domain-containing sensor histidine kinase [Longimicrobiales bacterium]